MIQTHPSDDLQQQLTDLESQRCAAVSRGDVEFLDSILDADLTHTHVMGVTQTKAEYLAALTERPRFTSRESLKVRLYGSVAVMTGTLRNHFPAQGDQPAREGRVTTLQVWLQTADAWRMTAFAASAKVGDRP